MNKIKGFTRKFAALVLAVVSIFSFSLSPTYAAELSQSSKATESTGNNVVLRRSMKLVAFNQAEVYSKGTVSVYLDSSIWGGYLALTASGGSGEVVNVSVKFPDGSTQAIGACISNGASSISQYYFHLPKGNYTFYADGIDHFYALACIYNK